MISSLSEKWSKLKLRKVYFSLLALYAVFFLGWGIWANLDGYKNSSWLLKKHADPYASTIFVNPENDWCGLIALDEFIRLTPEQRTAFSSRFFDKEILGLIPSSGLSENEMREWFKETAINAEKYPIKEVVLSYAKINYRDLKESGFPKQHYNIVVRETILGLLGSKAGILVTLCIIGVGALGLLIFMSLIYYLFSKEIPIQCKSLIILSVIIIVALVIWIQRLEKDVVIAPSGFNDFFVHNGYVSASGTWESNVKMAWPLHIVKLECFQDKNFCVEATASKSDNYVRVDTDYWDITDWGNDEIKVADNESSICASIHLRIDIKNKSVTKVASIKQPTTDECKSLEKEYPLVQTLKSWFDIKH